MNFQSTIHNISRWLQSFQVKHFLGIILVGCLMLTSGLSERPSQAITDRVDAIIHQDDSQRPKTTGEWQAEALETENAPGERIERIGEESADALRDWASLYPDVAEETFENDSVQTR